MKTFDFEIGSSEARYGGASIAALFGGLASEATGGKFQDGAMSAAVVYLFNDDGNMKQEWQAVSGREGYQDSKYQYLKNKGPIPGEYIKPNSQIFKVMKIYHFGKSLNLFLEKEHGLEVQTLGVNIEFG